MLCFSCTRRLLIFIGVTAGRRVPGWFPSDFDHAQMEALKTACTWPYIFKKRNSQPSIINTDVNSENSNSQHAEIWSSLACSREFVVRNFSRSGAYFEWIATPNILKFFLSFKMYRKLIYSDQCFCRDLSYNSLTVLPAGVFDPMRNLYWL